MNIGVEWCNKCGKYVRGEYYQPKVWVMYFSPYCGHEDIRIGVL